ncbi:MAG: T9SS type A sorting domain-containing protein [Flavobacteriales bacterium]|nr:T9SS type A sorting domain-containing protein [Flavobacteriales bacterium]MBK6943942.1 T9SS type A sorting domain-containing protein [Flavobacteriales bacterium]MBK7240150.1 T9SS type A sorting domain-containing protein [Flavobacteriales bacterium]MBK7297829.1 T9SS type A sorting domain-containing protein [Flavobacteriales bacterium]MBK9533613.1 T9SS type A sorting domain-containing protein [Flavobacteriales bacterium]
MKQASIVLFLLFTANALYAEHLPGGSITYKCVGNSLYEINLTLFRECSGTAMIPQEMRYDSDCGISFVRANMLPDATMETSQLCAASMANSNCNGGPLSGYLVYTYIDTLFLTPCDGWTISWDICCRSASLNLSATPGLYMEAKLNNVPAPCNSSSQFTQQSLPNVCVNQPIIYDAGAVDDNAFRRNFSLVDARYYGGSPALVTYTFPNYGGEPIVGMTIDAASGEISFTPTNIGNIVTVIQVDEYDSSDIWIGSVMRDLPFVVVACTNAPPDPHSGTIASITGDCEQTGERSLSICSNGEFCLTTGINDPTASDVISLTTNIDQVIPGATIQISGTNPVTATICGNANGTSIGIHPFTITAVDNACPIPGLQVYTYQLTIVTSDDPLCSSIGIQELEQPTIRVHPNPTNDRIIITGTLGTNGNWQLSLFDLQGRKVLERTVALTSDGAVLSLTTIIANGTYSLKLTDLTNGTTINTSVILDR